MHHFPRLKDRQRSALAAPTCIPPAALGTIPPPSKPKSERIRWQVPRDPDGAVKVLREAVEAGVNHIDTSDFYGPHVTKCDSNPSYSNDHIYWPLTVAEDQQEIYLVAREQSR